MRAFETFYNKKFLLWGIVSPTSNPQAGGTPLVGCPRLLIQYIRSYPPYLEDFPTSATWGRATLWWQGTHLTWDTWTLKSGNERGKMFNLLCHKIKRQKYWFSVCHKCLKYVHMKLIFNAVCYKNKMLIFLSIFVKSNKKSQNLTQGS
jgi:hypothetical protein